MGHHHEGTKGAGEQVSFDVIGAAIEVHRRIGPGLLESAYEACLCRELELSGHEVRRQVPLPMVYRGMPLDCGYRLDLLVDRLVIVEVKSVARVAPIHYAQLLTYLRLQQVRLGLILNFNVEMLRDGIHRIVNG